MKTTNTRISDPEASPELHSEEIDVLRQKLADTLGKTKLQEERLRAFSHSLKLGFWEWDEVTQTPIHYSDELARIFGYDAPAFAKKFRTPDDYHEVIHPDDLDYYREQTLDDNKPRQHVRETHYFDYRILHKSGEIRYVRESEFGQYNDSGELITTFGVVHDVSEYKNTLEALSESEHRFSSLFAQLPLGVQEEDYSKLKKVVDKLLFQGITDIYQYLLDNPDMLRNMVRENRITNVNEALLKIHEADSLDEFLEEEADVDSWWDAGWVGYYAAEIAALMGNQKLYEAERVDTRIDGSLFETRTIVSVVRGCEDSWERIITIHEDISSRRKSELALIEAKTQAEKANQAKSEFLSSMSHELRTPLNAILGFSQLFEYDRNLDQQHLANAGEISRAGRHLMSLIEQILDLSRIEAGEVDLSMEPVSLAQVLHTSVTWVAPLAQEREVSIEFDISSFEGILISADSIRLKQVFLNLLSNAVKYNHQGGKVSLRLEERADGQVGIGISDTGIGISADKLKELFQPFNRLGAEFSGVEGSGIGLVITRQLVELLNGRLDIESESGVGSTFWVNLRPILNPAAIEVVPEEMTQPRLIDTSGRDTRILVAEDNPVNRELMAAQLQMLGYRADFAEDGVVALKQWQAQDYDLLLTDIRMPEMDGYQLVREIRQLPTSAQATTAIIAITANALEADVKKCFEAGVDDVISKPVELEELRAALEKWSPQPLAEANNPLPGGTDGGEGEAVDLSVLRLSTGDKPDLHRQLLQTFAGSLSDSLEDIQQAFAWKNHEQLVEYTHKLKSSASSMGALRVGEICQQMEIAATKGDWQKLEQLLPGLLLEETRADDFIRDFLGEPRQPQAEAKSDDSFNLVLPEDEDVTEFSIRVLLVDDDYIMHRVTTVILNDLGISRVISAMSGAEALELIQQGGSHFDVIICDLNMPEMDGIEFIRHLAREKFPGSIILSSGEDVRILKTVEKLAIEHDMQVLGILEKPVTPAKLGELLETLDQVRSEGTMMMVDAFALGELKQAISHDELDTYFQPKIDIESGRVVGVEALARWNHPLIGLIRPDAFITMAEENGLIVALTDVVCHKALAYAGELNARGHDLNVAINISVDALTNLQWPDQMSAMMETTGLDASKITFEITESRLMDDLSVALDILSRLSLKRFNLSIDDFGTGYSSMEQLQRIPFSEFKIDRAFVHGASGDSSARAILESSVLLAKKLNMSVVAEGVEDQRDWDLVEELGCHQVQGYFISRPLPFDKLLAWLEQQQKS